MTIEEKLDNFSKIALEEATEKSNQIIEDYQKGLDSILDTKKSEINRHLEASFKLAKDKCERNKNKAISDVKLTARMKVNQQSSKLRENIYSQVLNKLNEYMTTQEYYDLLVRLINEAVAFAKETPMIIYIDPADECRKEKLEKETGVTLTISNYSFIGGIRATIESKNILIDNSFESKLAEEKEKLAHQDFTKQIK